jgi:hypothetical protein
MSWNSYGCHFTRFSDLVGLFSEGDMVLLYKQDRDMLGAEKFEAMWRGPYIIRRVLEKGAYELVYYDGIPLSEPINGLYLKKYYA